MIRKLLYLCTDNTDPYHNLALEQYLTDTVPADTCILYLWQNRHTVVIGRNQNAWQECRTALLEQDGGKLSRRLSGGGAVYHDMGNLNFTFSLPTAEYDLHRQQRVIVEACRSLGIEASFSGRNDILAAGRKFSGNSFYHHNGCSFHNGTLLVSVDMANLGKYLTPSQRKLQSKGVASVPSRVVNLSELHPGLRISQMQQAMAQAFADVYGLPVTTITESQLDASEIEARRMRFASYDWIYGRAQPFPFSCGARYPWGEITLELQVEDNVIVDRMSGRRVCEKCGASYHIVNKKSKVEGVCDLCGGKTVIRKDDQPATVLDRLKAYHEQTEPLVEFYRTRGKLAEIKFCPSIEETTAEVMKALEA